jgi:hypothetical protein
MEGPLIFIACLVVATLCVFAALYGICKGHTKPDEHPYRNVRFWNFR